MWMDGILNEKTKKRRRRNRRRRNEDLFTVSARVKEKNAERRKRIAAVCLILVVLVGFGWVLQVSLSAAGRYFFTENEKYQIRNWDLHSNGPLLTAAHIREYSQLSETDNLFAVDLREVRRSLLSVPVVRSVEVSRRLPDTLVVRVNERLAVARLGDDDRMSLAVDQDGHVLGPGSLRPNLPAIVGFQRAGIKPGITITDTLFLDALRFLELCERPQVSRYVRVRHINVSDPEELDIRLSDGERVRIARAHMEARLAELVGIIENDKGRGRVASVINMTGEAHIPPVVQY